jgi:hypothetical protein
MSRPVLGPIPPSIQWTPVIKRKGREADHSPLPGAEVMNVNIPSIYRSSGCYTLIISSVQLAQVLDFKSTKLCVLSN